ncbi:MAG: HepT-like ribonuclease domain-containing protein, partial [Candidatus Aenigmatarchaeota archaeon]
KLAEKHIISKNLIKKIRIMKKFRNVLVHQYGMIDDRIVYNNLRSKLDDFNIFKKEILRILKKQH